MKILIHALGTRMGGALRHLTNFLPELGKQDQNNQYVVLVHNSISVLSVHSNIQIDIIETRMLNNWLFRLYLDNIIIPRRLKDEHFDILVTLTNFGPIKAPCKHILFQRSSLYYCTYYLRQIKGVLKLETLMRQRLAVEAMKRADLIVTPSNAMREMIRKVCPEVANKKFYSLYHGYSHTNMNFEPLQPEFIYKLNRPGIKLLYPTHPAPHKGFEVLFDAIYILEQATNHFTLYLTTANEVWPEVVSAYEAQIKQLNIGDHVVFLGSVPQTQMGELYNNCDLMVYPSLCESFGFSMLEAMNAGLPIIASDTDINREICGTSAVYYPPLDSKRLAEILITMCQTDKRIGSKTDEPDFFDWSWKRYVTEFLQLMEKYGRN